MATASPKPDHRRDFDNEWYHDVGILTASAKPRLVYGVTSLEASTDIDCVGSKQIFTSDGQITTMMPVRASGACSLPQTASPLPRIEFCLYFPAAVELIDSSQFISGTIAALGRSIKPLISSVKKAVLPEKRLRSGHGGDVRQVAPPAKIWSSSASQNCQSETAWRVLPLIYFGSNLWSEGETL